MLRKCFLIYGIILGMCVSAFGDETPLVIVIPSYNNVRWCEKNIRSVLEQRYTNYRVIYIDDASTDATDQTVEKCVQQYTNDYKVVSFSCSPEEDIPHATEQFIQLVNRSPHFFTLVRNQYRQGCALSNQYRAIWSCRDDEVIVLIDGDDWLAHDHVFAEVDQWYQSGRVWFTHGKLIEYPTNQTHWSLDIPQEIIANHQFRKFRMPSHLKTFYCGLFKKVKLQDLLYQGRFCPMTGDMAMLFPMIEMASERHAFIHEVNYVYNIDNNLNDNKVNPQLQRDIDAYIRSLPPYSRLDTLDFLQEGR